MEQLTKRQKQAIETKMKISKTAMELFKHNQMEDVKVSDICKEANISVGAFYHHFSSKEAIIKTAYNSLDEIIISKIKNQDYINATEKTISIFEEATIILTDYGYEFVANGYKIMLNNFDESTFSKERSSYVLIASTIEEAIKNREINTNMSSYEITDILMAAGRGLLFDWCLHKGNYNLTDKMTILVNKIINSLN